MGSGATSRWRIALDTKVLTDTTAGKFVTGIEKVAPQSALMQVPAIAASYAALSKKNTALATAVAAVAADETQLKADVTTKDAALTAVVSELVSLKSLVAGNAASEGDITGMGFVLLNIETLSRTKPDAPASVLVKVGKVRGKARVVVEETGTPGHYVAEVSNDPIGIWTSLPGNGKQRKLSGYATGTKLWVRFAQVRWGLQSDWCTPVLFTIP